MCVSQEVCVQDMVEKICHFPIGNELSTDVVMYSLGNDQSKSNTGKFRPCILATVITLNLKEVDKMSTSMFN